MTNMSRRDFLKRSVSGLLLGFRLPAVDGTLTVVNMAQPSDQFTPNAYLHIATDGTVTVMVHRSEMGQGVNTAIPMILGDELEVDWSTVHVEQAPADPVYGDQVTGGSQSIRTSYMPLRNAGAAARAMLLAAAAQTWDVDMAACAAEHGRVIHQGTGNQLTYGELVEAAATLPVPGRGEVALKDPEAFWLIGTRKGHIDNQAFVSGQAVFASDMQLPGMLVATVIHCPVFGGRVASFDASEAETIQGVRHVIEISSGVAVVADHTWTALQGRNGLKVVWDEGENADLNSEVIRQSANDQIRRADDAEVFEAVYEIPFLAHATMEPMTCVADVREDGCDVWAPTQNRQLAKRVAVSITGLASDLVNIHVPLIGGGFGRRLQVDYVREAVEISQGVGAPVKLFWLREDDMQHDFYHPFSLNYRGKRLGESGRFQQQSRRGRVPGIPTGAWRSVEHFTDAFANACFIDELATANGQDPLAFHLAIHEGTPRQAVLELAADNAGWGSPLPDGWGRGIAVHSTFGVTHVAMVADVSVEGGQVRVHRVVCAVDCGRVINPDAVEAQMEGGIAFGLSAALHGEITIANGRVQQSNFHDYPILQMDEMPDVEVYIIESEASPQGIGEMGVPPIAPAVANAIYAATGERVRRLPIRIE